MTETHLTEILSPSLENKKAIEHNDLIKATAKMSKPSLKVFEYLVAHIDPENPPKDYIIQLSKEKLYEFFQVKSVNRGTYFKNAIQSLQKEAVFVFSEKENKERVKTISIAPITTVTWNNYDDFVYVRMNQDIWPYITNLKKDFTQYPISEIIQLEYKNSIVIYKLLYMYYNNYENYAKTGLRTEKALDKYKNPTIAIADLRELTETTDKYTVVNDFLRRVIEKAVSDINAHTKLKVQFSKIKIGRNIKAIQFYLDKEKPKAAVAYKENDETYLEQKQQTEIQANQLVLQAMQHRYTNYLNDHGLISLSDIQNTKTMIQLIKSVYPIYEQIENLRGKDGLKNHMSYVFAHRQGYDERKQNIAKYLQIAAAQYLNTILLQDAENDFQ